MLEDNVVRDSMKLFVKSLIIKNDEEKGLTNIKEMAEDNNFDLKIVEHDQDIESIDQNEKARVEKLLLEYHKNNPLNKLNFFKNKVKIPFSFTHGQRGSNKKRIWTCTLFVGSEICN